MLNDTLGHALDYQTEIGWFLAAIYQPDLALAAKDWTAIEIVTKWLCLFQEVTEQMSATKHVTLSAMHSIFHVLQDHLQVSIKALPHHIPIQLWSALIDAHLKLSDYYGHFDELLLYLWACCKCYLPLIIWIWSWWWVWWQFLIHMSLMRVWSDRLSVKKILTIGKIIWSRLTMQSIHSENIIWKTMSCRCLRCLVSPLTISQKSQTRRSHLISLRCMPHRQQCHQLGSLINMCFFPL